MRATSHSKPTLSRKAGRAAARTWRWLVQRDRQCIEWMSAAGVPHAIARVLSWCVKLLVLLLLLYTAVWIAVLLLAILGFAWIIGPADAPEGEPEPVWRNGWAGYGLYRGEIRIDPGGQEED
ncbi:DUF3742 family protein [Xanthomonas euvesicatoria]|uniref:DUF3742 family protein n=1 Tax=Xanthomonas citri TaxID=346 RepID=UPI000F8101FB|nr:DUF3742 family protein [Xanthomonas axonopodis]MEE5091862.1 DUF3742 family protein [Xanthomonas euvesicatoria]RTE56895.1 DUF3742 family protein [Xanthomonas axonopodis pv. eucalyptorum]